MTLTKTIVNISAATLSTERDSHRRSMCSPSEVHALRMLLAGATSGRLKEWPVLMRALTKKGIDFDPNDWCGTMKNVLLQDHFELNPYCDGLSERG